MKLMMFAASLRKGSDNRKLILIAKEIAEQKGIEIDYAEYSEFLLPLYNYDIQEATGFPAPMKDFIKRMKATDGLVIASPEYNFSTPGTLKNLIDWVSRESPMPWDGQKIMLMSASPALCGGNRGLWATRVPLECCGAFVHPKMFSLPQSNEAFTETHTFKDPKNRERVAKHLDDFIKFLSK